VDKWAPIDLATHSFGQGISATPVQLAMAYAAIANGGILMRPFIVRRAFGPDGQVLWENQPRVVRRVVSEKTARSVTNILKGVVGGGGTGVMAAVDGFEVAGKTGTAQKADTARGGYAAKKRVASFIGFAPADDPRLVMLVIIDEPEVNVYGGVVAAPAFRAIAAGALRRLGVSPDKLDSQPLPVPPESAAPQIERKSGPVGQKADGSSEAPDFIGLSLREAVAKARELKLRVELRGTGYVVKQSPSGGANGEKKDVALTLNLQG
jgi:cell division protein FtsI (penicillin-binding protein 3)